MTKQKRILTMLLIALLTLGSFTACNNKVDETVQGEVVEKPTILTNVYRGEDIEVAEDYSINDYLGMEDGNMVFLASYFKELVVTDDDYQYESWPALCYIPVDGGEVTFTKIEGHDWVNTAVLIDGGYMLLDSEWDEATDTNAYYLEVTKDGETTKIENLSQYFSTDEDGWFYVEKCIQDAEGYTYLFSDQQIAILKPDYSFYGKITLDNWVSSVDKDADGNIYVQYYQFIKGVGGGYVYAPIDRDNKTVGEAISLPDTIQADEYFFGDGYTLYYTNGTGIYGYNEGDTDGTLLMHFENSDITGDLDLVKALDDGKFLLEYYDRITWERKMGIFSPVDDIDLSQITVLELANSGDFYNLSSFVVEYNRNHTDCRIVTTDYSQYNTDEDYDAGNTKLANDILNGLYKPDMICGYTANSAYMAVLNNDLYLDMTPYINSDKGLDLFGCVTGTYQKDGKIFGLPISISINAVLANKSMVGDIDGWTVDELLAYLKTLPEGVEYMSGLTQDSAVQYLLGNNGYGSFVDQENGTCSFDSDTFIAFLEYIATLPAELSDDYYETYYEDQYGATKRGEVVAVQMGYSGINDFLREKVYFGADNVAYIGYPTASGKSGIKLNTTSSFTILADSEHPDLAWDFIRESILLSSTSDDMSFNLPVLRDSMDALKEEFEGVTFVVHYDGGMSWGTGYDPDESERENGEVFQLTEEDWVHIENFLDTVGSPAMDSTLPENVESIIEEELSSYLGGTKSAADCAKMIQNRVSLYLAEQS